MRNGRMAELVDALDSKSNSSNAVRVRVSLRPPKKQMDLAKTDNLLNVFFKQYKKQNSKEIFLNWLKFPEKNYSWEETKVNIIKLAKELK